MHRLAYMVDLPPGGRDGDGEVVGQLPRAQLHGREQPVEAHEQHAARRLALRVRGRQQRLVARAHLGR